MTRKSKQLSQLRTKAEARLGPAPEASATDAEHQWRRVGSVFLPTYKSIHPIQTKAVIFRHSGRDAGMAIGCADDRRRIIRE